MNIGKRNSCFIAGLLFLTLFLKICCFQYYCYQSFLIKTLLTDPYLFGVFWLNKIVFPLLFAGIALLFKKKYWTIVLLVLIDLWIIANLIYFRMNRFPLDAYAFTMAGNMKGFWGSIFGLIEWRDIVFPILTIAYCIPMILLSKVGVSAALPLGVFVCISSIIIQGTSVFCMHKEWEPSSNIHNPFSHDIVLEIGTMVNSYCYDFSVVHLLGLDIADFLSMKKDDFGAGRIEFTENEKSIISDRVNTEYGESSSQFSDPLIIILVESFESWAIHRGIMPNLFKFLDNEHIIYADKVVSQTRGGTSADGQMIVNTGLLPLSSGAACYRYPFSTYPGLAKSASGKSIALVPHSLDVWNQKYMSDAYGYDISVQIPADDEDIFYNVLQYYEDGFQMIQTFTLSSHLPFEVGSSKSTLILPADMPPMMSKYLKCMNYTDSKLQIILTEIVEGKLKDATIVITADHYIFGQDRTAQFQKYADNNGIYMSIANNYCPLIIYSPKISNKVTYSDVCYQMDIYPTICSILGQEHFIWKGLGSSLLDQPICRGISSSTAYDISGKIIETDYFKDVYIGRN